MSNDSITGAREFVTSVELPDPPELTFNVSKDIFDYDAAKQQAVVVGADVIAFVKGITPEQRNDIVNAQLLAGVRDQIASKLIAYTSDYIQGLPDL